RAVCRPPPPAIPDPRRPACHGYHAPGLGGRFFTQPVHRRAPTLMTIPKPPAPGSNWRLRLGARRPLVVFGDLLCAVVALGIGILTWLVADIEKLTLRQFLDTRLQAWFFVLPVLWVILLSDSYDARKTDDVRRTFRAVAAAALLALVAYMAIYF